MGEELQRWTDKKFDLLIDLVYLIGQSLGYKKIDKATLRDNSYIPQAWWMWKRRWLPFAKDGQKFLKEPARSL
jgi:hypothetical protein